MGVDENCRDIELSLCAAVLGFDDDISLLDASRAMEAMMGECEGR